MTDKNVMEAASLLRQAAQYLAPQNTAQTARPADNQTSQSRLRSMFSRSLSSRPRRGGSVEPTSFWSHRFLALANPMQETVPNRQDKQELFEAGLGERRITLIKNDDASYLKAKVEEVFPKMKDAGGFELLRTGISSRVVLDLVKIPTSGGYTSRYLSDASNLGQPLCFIRPVQRALTLSPVPDVNVQATSDHELLETCLTCGKMIALSLLRDHASVCEADDADADQLPQILGVKKKRDACDEKITPPNKKRAPAQTPVCQFACVQINGCSENISEIFDLHSGLLHEAGFRRMLTLENKTAAINALKFHFGLYKYMAPMLQFIEGLKLHGILSLLQANVDDGMAILSMGKFPSADKVMELFTPSFSNKKEEKEIEELIIYHWNNFLKKVERGNVSSHLIDLGQGEDITESIITLNMGHVLQALVGCPRIPINMRKDAGSIEFDHSQSRLSTANTCAPSLCFSSTTLLQDYKEVENHIINIIKGTDGFGIA